MRDISALGIRTDDQHRAAVRIHVIYATLRVILDDEDRRIVPDRAMGDRIHDLAEGKVVISDKGAFVGIAVVGSFFAGMIVGKTDDGQCRVIPSLTAPVHADRNSAGESRSGNLNRMTAAS